MKAKTKNKKATTKKKVVIPEISEYLKGRYNITLQVEVKNHADKIIAERRKKSPTHENTLSHVINEFLKTLK